MFAMLEHKTSNQNSQYDSLEVGIIITRITGVSERLPQLMKHHCALTRHTTHRAVAARAHVSSAVVDILLWVLTRAHCARPRDRWSPTHQKVRGTFAGA